MGDRSNVKIPGANTTGVWASEGLEPRGSRSKDPRDLVEAPLSKPLVASTVEDAHGSSLSPRCTLSCDAVERQALEDGKWTSVQRSEEIVTASSTGVGFVDDSFRSEDSEALALWEEKERSPKAVSTDLSWLKPAGSQSPWLGSVSNVVRKMEILSHAWARTSSVDPKAALDSSRPSLEYLKRAGGRSSWKDFKIVSSPMRSSETVLQLSSKVRYSNKSPYRRPDGTRLPFSGPISATSLDSESPNKLRHSVNCEILVGSSRAVDLNRSRQADDESDPTLRSDSGASKPNSVEVGMSQRMPSRVGSGKFGDADNAPQTIAAAAERAISRQSIEISAEAVSSSKERCSSSRRSQSMNAAMLIDCASEPGRQQARAGTSHSQETRERKASQRYYERFAAGRKKSSCWNSFDESAHLDHTIDFVAPSAARFLEEEGSFSPVRTPIKTPGAVPFKWEEEPGKPKEDSDSVPSSGQLNIALPLPPRLAVGHQLCPSVSSASHYQCHSPLRSPCGTNATMSGSLRELYALPSSRCPASESQKVLLPWFSTSFGNTSYNLRSASSERPGRDPRTSASGEFPIRKSKSIGEIRSEIRSAPQSFSRLPVGVDAGDRRTTQKPHTNIARLPDRQKPAHASGVVRPPSPTSILCGPDAGSRSSSNDPSLSSEHEAHRISATAASPLSQSSFPALISFDSIEHRIDNSSELLIPGSSLTSPFCHRSSSVSYNPDFEEMRKYLSSSDYQKEAGHSESAFVKFCKIGKRWMKTKSHAKLGTNSSPEVWMPTQLDANSDFSARLGAGSSHSQVQTEGFFVPNNSAPALEDLGNRSPVYTKPPPRTPWKSTRRLRTRARLRARFLVCTLAHDSEMKFTLQNLKVHI